MNEIKVPNLRNSSVFINGERLLGVKYIKTYENRRMHPVRELLMGNVGYVPLETDYKILFVLESEFSPSVSNGFSLSLKTFDTESEFSDCTIEEIEEVLRSPGVYEHQYVIKARNKRITGGGV